MTIGPPPSAGSQAKIVLRSEEFRRGREAAWRRLETTVERVEKRGIACLSADELQQLPLLYRTASSSLSVARSIALDRNLVLFLENLVLRAFFVVYAPRTGMWESLRNFLVRGFPAAVRACRWHILIGLVVLLAGGIAGFLLVQADEEWFLTLVPSAMAEGRGPSSTRMSLHDGEIFAPWPGFVQSFMVMANFLFEHNAVIAIMSFGLGIMAGIPTLLLLAYQGLVFGAFVALHYDRGLLIDFLGWASIHGITEFGAIIVSSAAGLAVAERILFPGRYTRLENLARNGKVTAAAASGAILMLFMAGVIEGGLRQLIADTTGRYLFALVTAGLWLAYFLSGRKGERK
jgi:uncharacterized membrane protein SpoIIM required for sporulation